ncbi:MAG: CDP-alcohol phosphatidyltransferase family protein [Candidatus Lokiarchaeota archaeon]|nr:CDP-alcohol phosphatidyltransferase family protein [Candidatus Lokiarchaeota archaeon]
MPSQFRVRKIFRWLVNLIAKGLIKLRVTPNLATIIMLLFSFFSFISLVCFRNLLYFSIFVFITGIMDGCDGAIARLTNTATKFGGFIDSFMDRFSEFFIFFGLLIFSKDQVLWEWFDMKLIVFISFFTSIMISYTRARAEVIFKGDFDIGLMARSERLFYLFLTMLISFFYGYMQVFLFIFMWLVIATLVFRITRIYSQINKNESIQKI